MRRVEVRHQTPPPHKKNQMLRIAYVYTLLANIRSLPGKWDDIGTTIPELKDAVGHVIKPLRPKSKILQ